MSTGPQDPDRPASRAPEAGSEPVRPAAGENVPATGPGASQPAGTPSSGRRAGEPVGDDGTGSRPGATSPQQAGTGKRAAEEPAETVPSGGGTTAGLWIALILGAIVLVLLLIFVIQNSETAAFEYFNAQFDLPLGVAMLLAAIAGALVMALVGSVRMIQMSWTIRRLRKAQEKIHRATR
ncbi:lipopolysaccharide assembly protein LapA domain-containing protein [Brachybacterium sp. GCM10030267]|uniref:LapA family protein n=1 Tax=Brachybacterium sp. GCM10030267 TaxID=3273381 RepID=UPI00361B777A